MILRARYREVLAPFCGDVGEFVNQLRKFGGMLTGTASFDILWGRNDFHRPNLMFVFASERGQGFAGYLIETLLYTPVSTNMLEDRNSVIEFSQRLSDGKGRSIQVVEVCCANPTIALEKLQSTAASTFVHPDWYLILHPQLFKGGHSMAYRTHEGSNTSAAHRRRYAFRGVKWVDAHMQRYRTVGDHGCHVGPMMENIDALHEVRLLRPVVNWTLVDRDGQFGPVAGFS